MSYKNDGSCLCGKVRFEIEGEFEKFFLCHCKYCQKDTGSAHAANLFSKSAYLKWISGKEMVKTFNLPDTRHVKSFCSHCGSALPSVQNDGKILAVPAGCIDTELSMVPSAHIFIRSKANWDENLEKLRVFDTFPE